MIGVVGAIVYATVRLLMRAQPQDERRPAAVPGRWRVAHYDKAGETHVVLQKVSETGSRVLDEHVVAAVRVDDPEYDAKFLAAMAAARERQALFEAEDA